MACSWTARISHVRCSASGVPGPRCPKTASPRAPLTPFRASTGTVSHNIPPNSTKLKIPIILALINCCSKCIWRGCSGTVSCKLWIEWMILDASWTYFNDSSIFVLCLLIVSNIGVYCQYLRCFRIIFVYIFFIY